MNYKGIIIEESLQDASILKEMETLRKRKVKVTPRYKTPWLTQWTLDTVVAPEEKMDEIAKKISYAIDTDHANSWYVDFKNDVFHYIIFSNKIFKVDLQNPILYKEAEAYGTSLGIPSYQMGFAKLQRKLE